MEQVGIAQCLTLRRRSEGQFLVAALVMIAEWSPAPQAETLAALIDAWLNAAETKAVENLTEALGKNSTSGHLLARRVTEAAKRVDPRSAAAQLIIGWAGSMSSPMPREEMLADFRRDEFRSLLSEALTPNNQVANLKVAADQDSETFLRRFSDQQSPSAALAQPASDVDFMDIRGRKLRRVQVFFGTNRASADGSDPRSPHYANARGEGLAYGIAEVTLPHDHQAGELERPWALIVKFDEDQRLHVVVQDAHSLERGEWLERGKTALGGEGDREAMLFVHGYNVSFDDAIRRSAQLAYDLKLTAMPLCFSWASVAQLFGYMRDEDTIQWSIDHLKEFLSVAMSELGLTRLHVVAHSMGSRAMLQVLHDLSVAGAKLDPLSQIVLAAPDVEALRFRQQTAGFDRYECVTMYASRSDWAIRASALLHRGNRASDASPPLVVPHVETIDVTNTAEAIFGLGHGYIASAAKVFTDLFEILKYRKPAAKRQGPRLGPQGDYYVLD